MGCECTLLPPVPLTAEQVSYSFRSHFLDEQTEISLSAPCFRGLGQI